MTVDPKKIFELFSDYAEGKTVLFHPSACEYHDDLQDLPFDYVYLNRHGFELSRRGKVICSGFDNNEALGYLHLMKISVHCFVTINDGCCEGGNHECAARATHFGKLMTVAHDTCEFYSNHIGDQRFLNVPWKGQKIDDIPAFLDILTRHSSGHPSLNGWRFQRELPESRHLRIGSIDVQIHWDSILSDYARHDALFISKSSENTLKAFEFYFNAYKICGKAPLPAIIDMGDAAAGRSIVPFLEIANEKGWSKIALTPFTKNRYREVIGEIRAWDRPYPREIAFYHLHAGDYKDIYRISL